MYVRVYCLISILFTIFSIRLYTLFVHFILIFQRCNTTYINVTRLYSRTANLRSAYEFTWIIVHRVLGVSNVINSKDKMLINCWYRHSIVVIYSFFFMLLIFMRTIIQQEGTHDSYYIVNEINRVKNTPTCN